MSVPAGVPLVAGSVVVQCSLARADGRSVTGTSVSIVVNVAGFGTVNSNTATVDATGAFSFTVQSPQSGVYTATVTVPSSPCVSAAPASVTYKVYQSVVLSVTGVPNTVCGVTGTYVAQLLKNPGGTGVANRPVTISYSGNAGPIGFTGTTDSNGNLVFQATAQLADQPLVITATHNDPAGADLFANSAGALAPETASFTATVGAATASGVLAVPTGTIRVGLSYTFTATFSRVESPSGPVPVGSTVTFTFTGPTTVTRTATTNAAGLASVSFPANTRGQYTVTATLAASSCEGTASVGGSFTVVQLTTTTLQTVSGVCGSPTEFVTRVQTGPPSSPCPV